MRHESFEATLVNSSILMIEAAVAYLTSVDFYITEDSVLHEGYV
jgi:hypothetical protein